MVCNLDIVLKYVLRSTCAILQIILRITACCWFGQKFLIHFAFKLQRLLHHHVLRSAQNKMLWFLVNSENSAKFTMVLTSFVFRIRLFHRS